MGELCENSQSGFRIWDLHTILILGEGRRWRKAFTEKQDNGFSREQTGDKKGCDDVVYTGMSILSCSFRTIKPPL